MQSPVRAVAHGAVLAVVAGLCLAVVVSGAFDVVSLPVAAPAVPVQTADDSGDGDAVEPGDDGAAPDDGSAPDGGTGTPGADEPGDDTVAPAPDPVCRDAEVAWGAAAKAQVNLSVEHPEDLVAGFTTARDTLAGTAPPPAIARDWAVVTTYLTMIADEVEVAGPDDTGELSRAIDRVGRKIDTASLTQASQRVTEFFRAGCTP